MAGQKIRIRLKSYDHEVIDSAAKKLVDEVTRTGATVVGPVPLPTSLITCRSHGIFGHEDLSKRRSMQGMLSHACPCPIAQGNHQKSLSPASPSRCSYTLVGGYNVSSAAAEW